MNFMSVNLPYPTSSLVDVLSILEAASEPAKLKKIIKELLLASIELTDAKQAHESKSLELEKRESEINKKTDKLSRCKIESDEAKKELHDKIEEYKTLDEEYKQKEESLKQFEARNILEKREYDSILSKGVNELSIKTVKLEKDQAECNKLIQEYSEKLAKLKAVME